MNDTKRRCKVCGVYCGYSTDSGTIYGCSDYAEPALYDPEFWCKKCADKAYQKALTKGEKMYVYWQMPDWQKKALKKLGLKKVDHKLVKDNLISSLKDPKSSEKTEEINNK